MSRRSNQRYACHALEQLARQLLYAPASRRAEDIRRAEALHDELDPAQNYPLEFLAFRITDHRMSEADDTTLVGEAVLPDLRLLIDSLSRSIELPPSEDEVEETTEQLAERLGVSGKTVARWRRAGLRWRWVTPQAGGPKRVVIPASALEHYTACHPDRAGRASSFSRIPEPQRRLIVDQARLLVAKHPALTLNQAAKQLAQAHGRGLETIRELLQKHDRERPAAAIFVGRDLPLDESQHAGIERAYLAGEGVGVIARRYDRARSTVYRVIHQCRARRALAQRFDYVPSPTFDRDDAAQVLLRPIAPPGQRARRPDPAALSALPGSIRPYFARPLPPDRLMVALLLRYNYLKHRIVQCQGVLRAAGVRAAELDRFDALGQDVRGARAGCTHAALPIVLSVCRRHEAASAGGPRVRLTALLLTAYPVLAALLESHDAAQSARFESVLTNRLLRVLIDPTVDPAGDAGTDAQRLAEAIDALGPASL